MLKNLFATLGLVTVVLLSGMVVASPAVASGGSGGCDTSQLSPTCSVGVGNGGSGGSSNKGGTPGAPAGFTSAPAICSYQGQPVPCETADGWWSNEPGNCVGYVRLAPPAEQSPPPSGQSAGAGAWYLCTTYCPPAAAGGRDCFGATFWSDAPPAGITTYTPAEAAALLVKSFPLAPGWGSRSGYGSMTRNLSPSAPTRNPQPWAA
jgi:hypothetical protein